MALRVGRSRAAAKSPGLPADSCGPAACKMELRPRTALVDIGNRVAEPRTRCGGRKVAVKAAGARGQGPGTRPVLAKAPEKRTREAAAKKVLSPVPETRSQPEPMQLNPQASAPMEISGCAPSGDVQCRAFSDVLLDIQDVDVKANTDPNSCSSYAKDIYEYLRDLETPILQYHMSYTERDLLPVMQHIAKNIILANESITCYMAIKKKYSMSKN